MQKLFSNKGISVIELLVGASILTIFIVSLVVVFQSFLVQSFNSIDTIQASFLAEEGIEAMKAMRDHEWSNVATMTPESDYYLIYQSNLWTVTSSEQPYVDGTYERVVRVSEVSRDDSDEIASTGTVDPDTLLVTVDVSWQAASGTTTRTLQTYITNFHE